MSDLIRRSDAIKELAEYMREVALQKADGKLQTRDFYLKRAEDVLRRIPTIEPKEKVIAQVTFDDEKLREIVKEAVERFKEEYEITDRPQGEWIDEADKYDASFGIHDYRCSNCNSYADEYIGGHEWYTAGKPNFCPHCGARMKGRSRR